MLVLLKRLHRLPFPRLVGLVRLAAEIMLVAALLGRPAPQPVAEPAPRHPAHPRYLGIDGTYTGDSRRHPPVLLDTETGALLPCPVAGMRFVGPLGCSPWRDGAGQYHLTGVGCDTAGGSPALVRATFPAGRVLDRVKTELVPSRQPYWFPDGSDRILFAGGDFRLYVFEFSASRESRDPDRPAPREVRWQVATPGVGEVWLRDPCWPCSPALGGRLIVTLTCLESDSPEAWRSQLWWLQLSPDGDEIVPAFSADGRWIYAWRWGDRKLRPERLAVPIMGDRESDRMNRGEVNSQRKPPR
jgi:hypothetical protein